MYKNGIYLTVKICQFLVFHREMLYFTAVYTIAYMIFKVCVAKHTFAMVAYVEMTV